MAPSSSLPSLPDQAERLIRLGVHDLAGLAADDLRAAAVAAEGDLLVTTAAPSTLAPRLRHGDKPGLVVEDMTDVDAFGPTEAAPVPETSGPPTWTL